MVNNLDDPKYIKSIDLAGMLGVVESFADQLRGAFAAAESADLKHLALPGAVGAISSIVTLGMGGSGIGSDVVKSLFEDSLAVPFIVNKGYSLPAFVDAGTLVVAVSYSGETEETLETFEKAVEAGANILVITGGGRILARSKELDLPMMIVPAGLQPRAAIGYLGFGLAALLNRIGCVDIDSGDFLEAVESAEKTAAACGGTVSSEENPAKQLAAAITGRMPVIYGSEGITAAAALRWKSQINENSKTPAFWNIFPELNHNEIVGWQELGDLTKNFFLIILRDSGERDRVAKRIEITVPLIENNLGAFAEAYSAGSSKMARLVSLVCFGDFVSVYLALISGVDPTPVESIRKLKIALSRNE
jgi:glucose/mannose-6-phosphate isomerase